MASSGSFDIKFVTKSIFRITCSEPAAKYKSLDERMSFELAEVTLLQDGPSAINIPVAFLCTKRADYTVRFIGLHWRLIPMRHSKWIFVQKIVQPQQLSAMTRDR